jgi:SAM-dependent methyltransferase
MEYATFAHMLQQVRTRRLPAMRTARHALVMGDGDGRFLRALLAANPDVQVDAVDSSASMLRLARRRAASLSSGAETRVEWHHADARLWQPTQWFARNDYDLVVTHFFLDCFTTEEVMAIATNAVAHMAPGALWIHSDFTLPDRGLMRWLGAAIVRSLYFGFQVLTGLQTNRLPDDLRALTQAGLQLQSQHLFLGGLMKSDLWQKPLR